MSATMASLTFDTHEYYKNLVAAGMKESHAEAIAVGALRAYEMSGLATKSDVQIAQAQTDAKIVNLDAKIDRVAAELDAKIDREIADVRGTLKVHSWMLGAIFAGIMAIIIQNFFNA